jgi:hypothetical protein
MTVKDQILHVIKTKEMLASLFESDIDYFIPMHDGGDSDFQILEVHFKDKQKIQSAKKDILNHDLGPGSAHMSSTSFSVMNEDTVIKMYQGLTNFVEKKFQYHES